METETASVILRRRHFQGGSLMIQRTRREFLRDVGTGAIVAGVGSSLASDLGFASAFADQGAERLTFGQLELLVSLIQDIPADLLLTYIVARLLNVTGLLYIL